MPPGSLKLLAAVVFVFITLEALIRAIPMVPDDVPVPYRAMPGNEAFAPVPGAERRSLLGVVHRVNGLALRGPDRPLAKRGGVVRVAVFGDSVVWGQGVAEEDGLVARLEKRLAERGRPSEVWNLGVPATNPFNHRARFERLAPLVRPDVTIVVVLFNDLEPQAARFSPHFGRNALGPREASPFPDSWRPALERVALYHVALHVWASRMPVKRTSDIRNFPAIEAEIAGIAAIARSWNSRVVLALASGPYPPAERYEAFARLLVGFAGREAIELAPLGEVLGNPGRREYFLPADPVHPSAEGHERIARALAEHLW